MKKIITVILFVLMCLAPMRVNASEAQGSATVTYKAENVIHIDKGDSDGSGPNTGDRTKLALWTTMASFSLMGLLLLLFLDERERSREEILC